MSMNFVLWNICYKMGKTNPIIFPVYKSLIIPKGDVALLGFVDNNLFRGDLYDLSLGNWQINSEWKLDKKYDTIICTRCAYFSKNPEDFIIRCYDSLNPDGFLFVDWGIGDHWRFDNYKIGWIKDGEHEFAYNKNNYLWSFIWDDSFLEYEQFKLFEKWVLKFGYDDVKTSIFNEIPSVLRLDFVKKYFKVNVSMLSVWESAPQLYIMLLAQRLDT